MSRQLLLSALSVSLLSLALPTPLLAQAPKPSPSQAYNQLVDRYFEDYYQGSPSEATYLGIHSYDQQLEDYSKAGIQQDISETKAYLKSFETLETQGLSELEKADRELIISSLKSQLLEGEVVRNWEKNPDVYSSGVTSSVFTLMSRNFAPAAERLKAVIARERQMPKVMELARQNLKNPPHIFTEVALAQLPGNIEFFAKDVPAAFASVQDPKLLAEFKASNQAVMEALQKYQDWLEKELLPQSKGDYRLGAETYRKKLLYDEMVDLPLERLLEIGYADLRRNQQQFQEVARQLDPSKTPEQILAELNKDYPPPAELLQNFRNQMGGLKKFIEDHQIITIPSPVLPRIEETPPFMRALTFASMDTPGPFETNSSEAYFNVTLPEPDWSEADVADYMAGFNYGTIISTAIHEAYPGHYVQFLWAPQVVSKVRKILGASSNSEGWAHYCEQMMLDQGYGEGNLKLKLGQLQDALLRNARYIVGIELHTGKMSFEEAVNFFVKEGYQTRTNGEREVERGTSDPTYLYYTLGKLQIQKLREDYQKMKGSAFSLKEFHDNFIKQGFPPIKLVRRALLGSDGEVL